jgi:3-oxoacyl-[acyl-carrier-protein] synthase-3
MNAFIEAIAYHLPEKIVTNKELLDRFPTLTQKEIEQLGIKSRRVVVEGETASDLAIKAAERLFQQYKIDKSQIDFLLFCAQEFDYYTPTTACVMQSKLGLSNQIGALDFNLGCSGFIYGLSLAKGLIETGSASNVLLLTSSTLTRQFYANDKNSTFLFGDGAAATLISGRNNEGIGNFVFGTNGSGFNNIIIKDGGARNPITNLSKLEKKDSYGNSFTDANFYMNGISIFSFSMREVPKMIFELLEKENLTMDDIDLFVFHQANKFILDKLKEKLRIPEEKFVVYLEHVGNTVSSTIPITLSEVIKDGKAKKGQRILLAGFGVGLSWGGTIITL